MTSLAVLHIASIVDVDAQRLAFVKDAVKANLEQDELTILICNKGNWPSVDAHWHDYQSLLCKLYFTQLQVAYSEGKPLFNCNVILESFCGYDVGLEERFTTAWVPENDVDIVTAWNQERLKRGLSPLTTQTLSPVSTSDPKNPSTEATLPKVTPTPFDRVVVGGTFDHIHAGHKVLLTMTALLGNESMVVGVTDDVMLKTKKHRELIASTEDRIQQVLTYLQTVRRPLQYEVVPITDPYGPTITDPTIQAIVCSLETAKGGEAVNHERQQRGFPTLEIRLIDVISPDNAAVSENNMSTLKVSSTWIREYLAKEKQ